MMKPEFRLIEGHVSTCKAVLANEKALIIAAQSGEMNAFQELYDHYRDQIHSLIYYSLNDSAQVEDTLQTVFIKVYKALPYFRLESSLLTWVYRVALNECKNRRRRRNRYVSLSEIDGAFRQATSDVTPERIHESQEVAERLRAAVRSLKPKHQQVILLKYLEDLSYEEVAKVIGCSAGTVASRLYRALQILESRLRASGYKKEVLR